MKRIGFDGYGCACACTANTAAATSGNRNFDMAPPCPLLVLERLVAFDLQSAHDASRSSGVVDRDVLRAAVVPECDRPVAPPEAARELGTMRVPAQVLEQRRALGFGHVLERDG